MLAILILFTVLWLVLGIIGLLLKGVMWLAVAAFVLFLLCGLGIVVKLGR